MELNARTYQNIVLTVIAVLLFVLVAQTPSRITFASSAWAQQAVAPAPKDSNAAAAASGMEIARQIGKTAEAIEAVAKSIDGVAATQRQP